MPTLEGHVGGWTGTKHSFCLPQKASGRPLRAGAASPRLLKRAIYPSHKSMTLPSNRKRCTPSIDCWRFTLWGCHLHARLHQSVQDGTLNAAWTL